MYKHEDGVISIEVESLKNNKNFVKCDRCWNYHQGIYNYSNICDRCCVVLISIYESLDVEVRIAVYHLIRTLQPRLEKIIELYKDFANMEIDLLETATRIVEENKGCVN